MATLYRCRITCDAIGCGAEVPPESEHRDEMEAHRATMLAAIKAGWWPDMEAYFCPAHAHLGKGKDE